MDECVYRVIDFSKCKYLNNMHEVIKQELELPDFYSRNLSALWDSITGITQIPAHISIRGITELPKVLQPTAEKMIDIFRRAETVYGSIKVEVEELNMKLRSTPQPYQDAAVASVVSLIA